MQQCSDISLNMDTVIDKNNFCVPSWPASGGSVKKPQVCLKNDWQGFVNSTASHWSLVGLKYICLYLLRRVKELTVILM